VSSCVTLDPDRPVYMTGIKILSYLYSIYITIASMPVYRDNVIPVSLSALSGNGLLTPVSTRMGHQPRENLARVGHAALEIVGSGRPWTASRGLGVRVRVMLTLSCGPARVAVCDDVGHPAKKTRLGTPCRVLPEALCPHHEERRFKRSPLGWSAPRSHPEAGSRMLVPTALRPGVRYGNRLGEL
jgi:hypothetical protein